MARARNIKPGFFRNEELAELPFEYRLLFIGLWTLADREGRLEDRPKRIRMEIFPADDVDCEAGINALATCGLVVRYHDQGNAYIWIPTFRDHQKPHPREVASAIPAYQVDTKAAPRHDQGNAEELASPADVLNPDVLNPESQTSPQEDRGEARATRLPHHWRPGAVTLGWTRAERPTWREDRIALEVSQFVDHYGSKGERRADWDAAWRNWVRRARDGPPETVGGKAEKRAKWAAELTGGEHGQRTIDGTAERVG